MNVKSFRVGNFEKHSPCLHANQETSKNTILLSYYNIHELKKIREMEMIVCIYSRELIPGNSSFVQCFY